MQRLALFELDNTLIDLDGAFQPWAGECAEEHRSEREAIDRLLAFDRDGFPHREVFFGKAREHFTLSDTVKNPWADTASACRTSSTSGPKSWMGSP